MSGPVPPAQGSYVEGFLVALAATAVFHPALAVAVHLLGQAGTVDTQGGWLPVILLANPMLSEVLWVPVAGVALRRRRRSLQALLVCAGLVFLLNGACWGVWTFA
ncbi:MAG: hypothetical protein ACK4YP_19225 [Myxococcota bacterium]